MAEFATLPLFTDAYMRDCWHLSDAEHGRYLLLLILIWQSPKCQIPNEPAWIANRMRRSIEEYERDIAPLVDQFCTVTGNGHWLTQKRLLKEYNYTKEKREKQSRAGKLRWDKEKASSERYADAKQTLSERNAPSPSPSPSPSPTNHHHPANGTGNGHAKIDDDKTAFAECERALRSIEGISAHPVAVAPVIAPIWKLVEAGYSLHATVIPSIRRQLAVTGKPISGWGYFVKGIVDDAKSDAVPSAPVIATKTEAEWERLLGWNRRKKVWDERTQGPRPHAPGCLVPAHLLTPEDGQGWIDFADYRP